MGAVSSRCHDSLLIGATSTARRNKAQPSDNSLGSTSDIARFSCASINVGDSSVRSVIDRAQRRRFRLLCREKALVLELMAGLFAVFSGLHENFGVLLSH